MAYNVQNPPVKLTLGPLAGFNTTEASGTGAAGGDVWLYKSADLIATVEGANYFSNAQALGMQPGDLLYILDTTTPHAYLTTLATVTANGGTTSGVHVTTQ